MHAEVKPVKSVDALFASIDAMDTEGFLTFLTDDCRFRFGSVPPVTGKAAIGDAIGNFFATIAGLSHSVEKVYRDDESICCEGEVCYRRHDGSEIILPFVDVFRCQGSKIADYRIYIDIGPLYAT